MSVSRDRWPDPESDPEFLVRCLEQDLHLLKVQEMRNVMEKKNLIARLLMLKCQLKESDGGKEKIHEN